MANNFLLPQSATMLPFSSSLSAVLNLEFFEFLIFFFSEFFSNFFEFLTHHSPKSLKDRAKILFFKIIGPFMIILAKKIQLKNSNYPKNELFYGVVENAKKWAIFFLIFNFCAFF